MQGAGSSVFEEQRDTARCLQLLGIVTQPAGAGSTLSNGFARAHTMTRGRRERRSRYLRVADRIVHDAIEVGTIEQSLARATGMIGDCQKVVTRVGQSTNGGMSRKHHMLHGTKCNSTDTRTKGMVGHIVKDHVQTKTLHLRVEPVHTGGEISETALVHEPSDGVHNSVLVAHLSNRARLSGRCRWNNDVAKLISRGCARRHGGVRESD